VAEISVQGLSKVYPNGVVAVRDVWLDVADGEFLVLVGPSGCGKSTLLRMIAGLEEVTAGALVVDGRDLTDAQPRDRDIAMVFQSYALYPHMTVRKNIGYPLRLAGTASSEIDARVNEAARLLQLEAVLDRKPGQLSGGQRQRVAMGRAIVRKPSAFLMDEPLSNLDAKLRVQMRAEICRLQREFRTTTVYVTHDQVEAMTMGDRVACAQRGSGRAVRQASRSVRPTEEPVRRRVHRVTDDELLPGHVERRDGGLAAVVGTVAIPLDASALVDDFQRWIGRTITVGIRSESVAAVPSHEASPRVVGTIEFVEELGSEVIVHTRVDELGPSADIAAAPDSTADSGQIAASACESGGQAAGTDDVPRRRDRDAVHRSGQHPLLRSRRAIAAKGS
jgi:multiple sugar transport system ATP-binding protein